MSAAAAAASTSDGDESSSELSTAEKKKQEKMKKIKEEGGFTAFNTKYGALNLYAIIYGIIAIGLGLFWYAALTLTEFLYFITGGRVDKKVS